MESSGWTPMTLVMALESSSFDLGEKIERRRAQINRVTITSMKQICAYTAERSRMGLRSCFIIKSHRTPEIVPQLFAWQLNKQLNDQAEPTNYRVPSRPENRTMARILAAQA